MKDIKQRVRLLQQAISHFEEVRPRSQEKVSILRLLYGTPRISNYFKSEMERVAKQYNIKLSELEEGLVQSLRERFKKKIPLTLDLPDLLVREIEVQAKIESLRNEIRRIASEKGISFNEFERGVFRRLSKIGNAREIIDKASLDLGKLLAEVADDVEYGMWRGSSGK